MATPYWGQLPGPKIVKNRRMSDDERRSSLDAAPAPNQHQSQSQSQNQKKRDSVLTAYTEAATDTTLLSPYDETPANSALASQGLAPRPPSFQRAPPVAGAESAAVEPSSRRSRRRSRNPNDANDPTSTTQQQLGPDAGRGPPSSYRHPHGGLPPTYPAASNPGKPSQQAEPPARDDSMDYVDTYTRGHQVPYQDAPYQAPGDMPPLEQPWVAPSGTTERRKNMTKEEKRARVEAAERRARERAARRASEANAVQPPTAQPLANQPLESHPPATAAQSSQPRHKRQSQSVSYVEQTKPIFDAHAAHTRSFSDETGEDPNGRQAPAGSVPLPHLPRNGDRIYDALYDALIARSQSTGQPISPTTPTDPKGGIPQRNLSFRERAARDDMRPPNGAAVTQAAQLAAAEESGNFSLTRGGSNKLKKEPRGDPWYHMRMEAEQKMPSTSRREGAAPTAAQHQRHKSMPQHQIDTDMNQIPPVAHKKRPSVSMGVQPMPPSANGGDIQGIQRRATEPVHKRYNPEEHIQPVARSVTLKKQPPHTNSLPSHGAVMQSRRQTGPDDDFSSESSDLTPPEPVKKAREDMLPGDGLYKAPQWLDEWKKAPVGALAGSLLNMSTERLPTNEKNKAWWEEGGRRRSSTVTKPRKPEAFEGEYDDLNAPTRFKPPLYLECGPLLRYCGIRHDKVTSRTRSSFTADREMWRGSVMIVTRDSDASYEATPTLRFFVQDMELLPAPPHQVNGDLSPEYVDPIAGHPKLGRRGESLYVRPVEHLDESKDLSQDETDNGLFESIRSVPDPTLPDGSPNYPGTFASRMKRIENDGERLQKYKDVRAFRLHSERGCTFWRFNIEVELRDRQQRIAYRINRGPCNAFWVPARGEAMNIMFHSCNGFSNGAKADAMSGPDPMWRDVLNNHQTSPFHVMVSGGNQIYNDDVADECDLFIDWLEIRDPVEKQNAPLGPELQSQLEEFYLKRYCKWFSQGLFGLANSQIPMVNMWSDRESFNGFGSYPHKDMSSPVLSGLGAIAFKYYMLFQHQSIIPETEESEPSWIIGAKPGPYVNELSRSVYAPLGGKLALLSADCRTERTEDEVINDETWEKIMTRLYAEVRRGHIEHLLVVFPVPIAYPRLVWLENVMTSRFMNPVKALGKRGLLGKALNNVDGGSEAMDDLRDHWTAKNHKYERSIVIEDLQDLAIDKSLRVTFLSGDVSLAAVGQFYSNPKLNLAKHKDPRYMPNIISSAISNAPPPDIIADVLNRRHKVHHFDKETDESMIPMFQQGVDGKPRNNKRLLPHRNWCAIRQWVPGSTPPPTPPLPATERSSSPPSTGGGLLRRLSLSSSHRPDMSRESVRGSRPPISGGGGLFRTLSRTLSRRNSSSGEPDLEQEPAKLTRTLSLGRSDSEKKKGGFFGFGRRPSRSHGGPTDTVLTGHEWGESDDDEYDDSYDPRAPQRPRPGVMGLRGGALNDEWSDGDEEHFTANPPRRAQTLPTSAEQDIPPQAMRPFYRTPTGLSSKQMRKSEHYEIDLEGGLDVTLNVEVNARDPTGITVPYRLLVPKLFYEYTPETDEIPIEEPTGFKRFLSLRKKEKPVGLRPGEEDYYEGYDEHDDDQFSGRR